MRVIDFSGISAASFAGRALRLLLRLVPKGLVVPILQGPLKGMRWVVGAQTHGMWLGSYELPKQRALMSALRPGSVFYDIGANVGFYTLLAARCVEPGAVFAFEPLPRNLALLQRHLELNRLSNVTVLPYAVASRCGQAHFQLHGESMSRLAESGEIEVSVVTIDHLVAQGTALPPEVMKVDVEGAEVELVRGALATLKRHLPRVFLALHSRQLYEDLLQLMQDERLPYDVVHLDGRPVDPGDYVEEVLLAPRGLPGGATALMTPRPADASDA